MDATGTMTYPFSLVGFGTGRMRRSLEKVVGPGGFTHGTWAEVRRAAPKAADPLALEVVLRGKLYGRVGFVSRSDAPTLARIVDEAGQAGTGRVVCVPASPSLGSSARSLPMQAMVSAVGANHHAERKRFANE